MDPNASAPMGARRYWRSRYVAAGESDRAYDADGRRIWPPPPSGFRHGSGASGLQVRRQAAHASLDPRRRYAARLLPARVLSQVARRARRQRKPYSLETFSNLNLHRREMEPE